MGTLNTEPHLRGQVIKEFTNNACEFTTSASVIARQAGQPADRYAAYIGLDVHKDTIAVAIAWPGRNEPESWGEIANKPKTIDKLIRRLSETADGDLLLFCYEAGPCGYGLYRQLLFSSIGTLLRRLLGGSRLGVSPMDSRICQTFAVSPAKPGDFPLLVNTYISKRYN